jgi:hypothetical protein
MPSSVTFATMSTYRLYRVNPEAVEKAELIDSADRERDAARSVFRRWPVAACLPYTTKSGDDVGAIVLAVWETATDAAQKRAPVALVRTFPRNNVGFKQQLWTTPVSA